MNTTTRPRRSALWILWPVLAAASWLGCLLWVAPQIGWDGVAVGLPLAIAVVVPIVAIILWFGRWERKRPGLLFGAFVWGAAFATFGAIWSQDGLGSFVEATLGADVRTWMGPLIITPLTEEVLKGLFLIWLLVYRRREITGLLDGVVFGALVGAGFSFTENILYIGRLVTTFAASDTSDVNAIALLVASVVLRFVLVPFMHPFFVATIGLGIAAAANARSRAARIALPFTGFAVAIAAHGIWDYAGLASGDPYLIYKIYGAVMVPLFVALVVLALILRRRTGRTIAEGLPTLARDGRIAPEEVTPLASLRERRLWRRAVRRRDGRAAAHLTGRYQAAASALAIRSTRPRTPENLGALDQAIRSATTARAAMAGAVDAPR